MEAILSNILSCGGEFTELPLAVDGRGGTGAEGGVVTLVVARAAGTGGGVGVGVDRVG